MNKICFLGDAQSTHLQKWARSFNQRGFKACILSLRKGEVDGVKVFHLEPSSFLGKLGYPFTLGKVKALLGEIKPDIVHAHYASSYGLLGVMSGFHPLVVSAWGSDILDFPYKSPLHRGLIKWVLNHADVIAATSIFLKEEVVKLVPDRKIEQIPFGVDTVLFDPRKYPNRGDRINTIICAKSLERKYGHEYLLEAFREVVDKIDGVRLVLLGGGSLENYLRNMATRLSIENRVIFAGRVGNCTVPKHLANSSIFVMPSIAQSETFGVAALEASSMELPVVATDVGGVSEVVRDGETGFLVPPRDVRSLAKKIIYLLNHPREAREMGKVGREFVVRDYSWGVSVDRMRKVYRGLL